MGGGTFPMLLWFRCANSLSFKEEVVLSFEATTQRDHAEFLTEVNGLRVLRVASVYGANASGKSNILKALNSVFTSVTTGEIEGVPFWDKYASAMEKIGTFTHELSFLYNGVEYKYGYEASETEVKAEWLVKRKAGSKASFGDVFTRVDSDMRFDNKEVTAAVKAFAATMKKSKNILFLTLAGRTSDEPFSSIYNWFMRMTPPNDFDTDRESHFINLVAKEHLNNADGDETGESYSDKFNNFIMRFDRSISRVKPVEKSKDALEYDIALFHGGSDLGFFLSVESAGTKKIISIYHPLMKALQEGGVVIVDELDTRLHPLILREIVRMFHDPEKNPKSAQLIFTAHNIVALNNQDMRRDEVYFVEKDEYGSSTIARLSDVETDSGAVRSDMDYGKNYLAGRFGAIPEIDVF